MAIDPEYIKLIRRFEPVLYFHPGEEFFPCDAKRYLERCALWKAKPPFDDKNSWEEMIAHGKIAGRPEEAVAASGDVFLGQFSGNAFPFLITNAQEERFLELIGWDDSPNVGAGTENRRAGLAQLKQLYDTDNDLKKSKVWYHAEAFDTVRLRELAARSRDSFILTPVFSRLRNPSLLCYYLFFPGHVEGIEGCEQTPTGPHFASFAGDWACVAILLEHNDGEPIEKSLPRLIGLTSRNVGAPTASLDRERRINMSVHLWEHASTVTTSNEHPRIFIARGTHSLYLEPGVRSITPFTQDDLSWMSCGAAEGLEDGLSLEPATDAVSRVKIVGGLVLGGLAGLIGGIIWSLEEAPEEPSPGPSASQQQIDAAPPHDDYGMVIKPPNVTLSDEDKAETVEKWPSQNTLVESSRVYTLIVDRVDPDPNIRHVWLPGDGDNPGYEGRWGPRVTKDPKSRRAGMRFPNFVQMFLMGAAKS